MKDNLFQIRDAVQKRLLAEYDGEVTIENIPRLRKMVEVIFNQVLAEENLLYTRANKSRMLEWVFADIVGYGPLEPFLNDPDITEIMVNGPGTIFIERFGKIEKPTPLLKTTCTCADHRSYCRPHRAPRG